MKIKCYILRHLFFFFLVNLVSDSSLRRRFLRSSASVHETTFFFYSLVVNPIVMLIVVNHLPHFHSFISEGLRTTTARRLRDWRICNSSLLSMQFVIFFSTRVSNPRAIFPCNAVSPAHIKCIYIFVYFFFKFWLFVSRCFSVLFRFFAVFIIFSFVSHCLLDLLL